jgi:hypothetical protein
LELKERLQVGERVVASLVPLGDVDDGAAVAIEVSWAADPAPTRPGSAAPASAANSDSPAATPIAARSRR